MNSKPLDTAMADFTAEELDAMSDDEIMARVMHTKGSIAVVEDAFAAESAKDVMGVIQLAKVLTATAPPEVEDPAGFIAPIIGQTLIDILVSVIKTGRAIESFALAYPDFPVEPVVSEAAAESV